MHDEAMAYLKSHVDTFDVDVLDIGGRDVNGSPRSLFTGSYTTVDRRAGRGVDIVADAADWTPPRTFDLVLCLEVFEHTPRWPELLRTARAALGPGGRLIVTAATDPRAPHSCVDGGPLPADEFYENVAHGRLADELADRFDVLDLSTHPRGDVYATAVAR